MRRAAGIDARRRGPRRDTRVAGGDLLSGRRRTESRGIGLKQLTALAGRQCRRHQDHGNAAVSTPREELTQVTAHEDVVGVDLIDDDDLADQSGETQGDVFDVGGSHEGLVDGADDSLTEKTSVTSDEPFGRNSRGRSRGGRRLQAVGIVEFGVVDLAEGHR